MRTEANPWNRVSERAVLALCVVSAALFFGFDLLAEFGVAAIVPYTGVVLLSLTRGTARRTIGVAMLASVLTIAACALAPETGERWRIVADRALALLGIWMTALLGNQRRAVLDRLRLRELAIHSASNGIVLADASRPGCPIVYANSAFERMCGYRADEVIGCHLDFLQGDERDQSARAALQRAIDEGAAVRVVLRNHRKDGSLFWNDVSLSPIHDENGALTHFIAIHADVTEQRGTEEQLQRSTASTRAILDAAVDGIFTIDEAGTIQSVNSAIERMFGYPKQELLGHGLGVLLPPPKREAFAGTLSQSLRTGNSQVVGAIREIEGQHKDGTTFPSELAVGEARIGDRRIFAGIIRDLSERKRAAEALRKTERRARAAEQLASIGTLTAGLAHEVGGPMNVILGYAQMIENATSEETVRDRARIIREQVSRISKIIETLLDFARPRPILKIPVDLGRTLDEVLNFLSEELRKRGIATERHIDAVPAIRGDAGKLQQLFLNLFINAMDAMSEGGTLRVSLTASGTNEVEVCVSDTGTGIPQEALEKIFEPFFTSKPRGKGSGLGLAVAKGIVSDHEGRIEVTSTPGEGTRFVIAFPANGASS